VGSLVLLGTGWAGGAVLAAFFVSSTAVGRAVPERPRLDEKSERRDAAQVVANGGPAALAALAALAPAGPGLNRAGLAVWIVTASLAAAAADTWATSIGGLSGTAPRRLGFGRVVQPGTNGGMTAAGNVGALAGAALVAGVGALAAGMPALAPAGTLVGFAGMLVDSALGALVQGRFRCGACDAESEWRVHRCGARTVRIGGLAWLDNDGVNLAATAIAAGLGAVAWRLSGG
jgi:uncharacterized protein (TIGR00297 family)